VRASAKQSQVFAKQEIATSLMLLAMTFFIKAVSETTLGYPCCRFPPEEAQADKPGTEKQQRRRFGDGVDGRNIG